MKSSPNFKPTKISAQAKDSAAVVVLQSYPLEPLLVALKMKPETRTALLQAYFRLQEVVFGLYAASEAALENEDLDDASLLASRADKLYEEVENLDILLIELEGE
ncbi:MAG: hypothetical protein JOZ78_17680 [Chroococcidiopsidaceae cyanobacterium CP_BM_ER_R8_30]|nr:hypothetical protein [Chroococcidiopsidaceae cyanobacterium CP_BM_ER_R8_30]